MIYGNTILVLDDESTYDTNGAIWIVTDEAERMLYDHGDAKVLEMHEHIIVKIGMRELLDAYNTVHGTNY